jgi:hypothetical protein
LRKAALSHIINDMAQATLRRIYAATPSRMVNRTEEICEFIAKKGDLPLHPFNAYPLSLFEGNPTLQESDRQPMRLAAMELCLEDVRRSQRLGLFGVSSGTLEEAAEALKLEKPIDLYPEFDPLWEEEARRLAANNPKHEETLQKLGILK